MIIEPAPLMARGSAAIDCGRAIQVPEKQSTFRRRATRTSIDYSKLFAAQVYSLQAERPLSVSPQPARQFALAAAR